MKADEMRLRERLARCLIPSSSESFEERHRRFLAWLDAQPPPTEEEERASREADERIGRMLVENLNRNVEAEEPKE